MRVPQRGPREELQGEQITWTEWHVEWGNEGLAAWRLWVAREADVWFVNVNVKNTSGEVLVTSVKTAAKRDKV